MDKYTIIVGAILGNTSNDEYANVKEIQDTGQSESKAWSGHNYLRGCTKYRLYCFIFDSKLRWNFSYLIMENEFMSVNTNLGFYTQLSGKLCGVRKIGR